MKKLVLIAILLFSIHGFSQTIFGKWKTVDGVSGEAKSIVEIYKKEGKVFGKIIDKLTKDTNVLRVRGYIAFLYATQYWERIKE